MGWLFQKEVSNIWQQPAVPNGQICPLLEKLGAISRKCIQYFLSYGGLHHYNI